MDILEDQKRLRQQNVEFLKEYATKILNSLFDKLKTDYKLSIRNKVFDVSESNEIIEYLKSEYIDTNNEVSYPYNNPYKFHKSIYIEEDRFKYSISDIVNSCDNQLVESIYPVLKKRLESSLVPYGFTIWRNSIINTCKKVYLKHLLDQLKKPQPNKLLKAPYPFKDITDYNNFLTYINKHIIDIHLDYSYLFQRLKKLGLIDNIKHLEFMRWLKKDNLIKEFEYNILYDKHFFYTLDKSTKPERENNFNNVFLNYK